MKYMCLPNSSTSGGVQTTPEVPSASSLLYFNIHQNYKTSTKTTNLSRAGSARLKKHKGRHFIHLQLSKKMQKKSEIHPNITRAYIKKLHCSWTPYKRIVFSFQYNAPTYGYRKNSIVSNNKKTVVFQKQLFFVWCVFTTQKHWYFLKSEAIIHNRWSHWRQLKQRGVSLQGFRTTRFLPQHLKSER